MRTCPTSQWWPQKFWCLNICSFSYFVTPWYNLPPSLRASHRSIFSLISLNHRRYDFSWRLPEFSKLERYFVSKIPLPSFLLGNLSSGLNHTLLQKTFPELAQFNPIIPLLCVLSALSNENILIFPPFWGNDLFYTKKKFWRQAYFFYCWWLVT